MVVYFLYGLFFISCVVLIGSILLQPGKADAGALFTSNISSTAFGPRGTASVLSKITIGAATVFMLTALLISMPALSGNTSVLNSTSPTSTTPTTTSQDDTITNLNVNTAPAANTNDSAANATAPANTNANK